MHILLFGETGQVAREVLRRSGPGTRITALPRDKADLADPAACAAHIAGTDADVVLNAAAYTAVDRAEEEEARATTINGAAPAAMARAAADRGLPFVHISTDYVFDGSGSAPWSPDAPTAPLGAYGRSKLAGEEGVREAGGPHAILRTSWVFSAHGGNFVKTMLRLSESRDTLTIVADQVGGPTPAAAIADACLTIATRLNGGEGPTGTYHFGGAPAVSWADFARAIFARAGRAVTVTDIPSSGYPTPAARPLNSRLDGATLLRDYAIAAPDWAAGLDDVL
ncbi:MAG: dTDP-4-dehydrorhamnose reductase, partial [Pseudomonadota bacterium]